MNAAWVWLGAWVLILLGAAAGIMADTAHPVEVIMFVTIFGNLVAGSFVIMVDLESNKHENPDRN